jgi:hypothetical protein
MKTALLILSTLLAASLISKTQAYAVAAGQPCGGGRACDKGLWCEPPAGMCASAVGVCVAVPRVCIARKNSMSFKPVCGCNRKTYSNDCFRRAYKVGKFHEGAC